MVIALDKHKKPVGFVTEKRARQLMDRKRACVYRYFPFSIILKDIDVRSLEDVPSYRIKIDPGSVHTGIAIVGNNDDTVYYYIQIEHRASTVKKNLDTRRGARRNRRIRETWYRRAKWGNKTVGNHQSYDSSRKDGWLPPSVQSIVDNIIHWVSKLRKLVNITDCSFEAVRIDTQLLDNPDIEGKEYQNGTLAGYELKEYLMDRYGHTCQYCGGASGDPVLEVEHKHPKGQGGSDKVSNLTVACHKCNQAKGNRTLEQWQKELQAKESAGKAGKNPGQSEEKPKKTLNQIRIENIGKVLEGQAVGVSDRYCAWVTSSRRATERPLFEMFGADHMECSSGGHTKYNRTELNLPKDHHYDALCVGTVPEDGYRDRTNGRVLYVKAVGRGSRLRGKINKCGIITVKLGKRAKRIYGFMNGDIVTADVLKGKHVGHHCGRVMVRERGCFDVRTLTGELISASYRNCKLKQYADGYQYQTEAKRQKGNSSR